MQDSGLSMGRSGVSEPYHSIAKPIEFRSGPRRPTFRLSLRADPRLRCREPPQCAISCLPRRSKQHSYSITSSARARNDSGIVSPIALAVLRLMINSIRVGCSTGRSDGLAP
jgi:hypothetical protein